MVEAEASGVVWWSARRHGGHGGHRRKSAKAPGEMRLPLAIRHLNPYIPDTAFPAGNQVEKFLFRSLGHSLMSKRRWYVGRRPNVSDCGDLETS